MPKALKRENLTGKRFGIILVLSFSRVEKKGKTYDVFWNCVDDFGFKKEIKSKHLKSGQIKSCGHFLDVRRLSGHPRWKGFGELSSSYFTQVKNGAKSRGLEFSVSIEFLWRLFEKQNRKCALTGIELHFPTNGRDRDGNASLDRIDSNLGYLENNVQWVHKDVNIMKMDFSQEYFIGLCRTISSYNSK